MTPALILLLLLGNSYDAEVLRVLDGDSLRVRVQLPGDLEWKPSVRMRGIDTPELRGRCELEKQLAKDARLALERMLPVGSKVSMTNVAKDKFGRTLADLIIPDGRDPAKLLIEAKLARPYAGEKRLGWC